MKIKPQNTKGTRDFLPQEVARRNYIFGTIKKVFRKYGFQEIETPAFERLETLSGKYGEEGDKLLFRILNSGDYLKDVPEETLSTRNSQQTTKHIADKGLRYDLTVPLARYVVQHQNDLVFPFKRFHIGPVWRADRPQKGRYQEFFQCDADVIGSKSLLNDIELMMIYAEVFATLGLSDRGKSRITRVRMNHKKIITGLVQAFDLHDKERAFATILDKEDKIGFLAVMNELQTLGLGETECWKLKDLFNIRNEFDTDSVGRLELFFKKERPSTVGLEGVAEMKYVWKALAESNHQVTWRYDIMLARGLDYYTGLIAEVDVIDSGLGSLGGGGRYDNLTEMFGGQNMSGVGISFGIERIYDVMEELNLFPAHLTSSSKILFVHFSETNRDYSFGLAQQLRAEGISAEVYPDVSKIQKQMKYANDKQIPLVAVVGDDEMNTQTVMLKNMSSGEQQKVAAAELVSLLR